MKEFVRTQAINQGLWIQKTPTDEEILAFLSELRPMYTHTPLKRFGPLCDGGYVMPNDLEGVRAAVSPGVSVQCGFDTSLADLGIDIYMADASVPAPPVSNEKFHFSRLFFDTYNSENTIRIDDFCKSITPGRDLIIILHIPELFLKKTNL